jgi:regulator of protease activity HflC (stomatin/prohibitin superfamily)
MIEAFIMATLKTKRKSPLLYGTFSMSQNDLHVGPYIISSHKKKQMYSYGCCCGTVAICLITLLVAISYHRIYFDEIALVRSITGVVDYDSVLEQGTHYLPLGKQPITFPATQQRVAFLEEENDALIVFSEQGLEFDFNIEFYYKLEKNGIGYIYKTFGKNFDDRINKISQSVIKDQATNYTSDQYIRERNTIATDFAYLLKQKLEPLMNIIIDPDFLVLLEINFPNSLVQKNLESTLELQNNILQQNQQAVDLIKAQTGALVAATLAEASFTIANAYIEGNQTVANAQAYANNIELNANTDGLNQAIQLLALNETESDMLIKAYSIRNSKQVKIIYGDINSLFNF